MGSDKKNVYQTNYFSNSISFNKFYRAHFIQQFICLSRSSIGHLTENNSYLILKLAFIYFRQFNFCVRAYLFRANKIGKIHQRKNQQQSIDDYNLCLRNEHIHTEYEKKKFGKLFAIEFNSFGFDCGNHHIQNICS